MRGFRCIGLTHPNVLKHIADDQMVLFAVDPDGRFQRNGGQAIRARHVKNYVHPHCALHDACNSDYVFVSTAIGEGAFDAQRQDTSDH